eukprot:scaffold135329_cov28-Tisochrysis_lutea.AAC.1
MCGELPRSAEEVRQRLRSNSAEQLDSVPFRHAREVKPVACLAGRTDLFALAAAVPPPPVPSLPFGGFPELDARSWFYSSDGCPPPTTPTPVPCTPRERSTDRDAISHTLNKISPIAASTLRVPHRAGTPMSEWSAAARGRRSRFQRKCLHTSFNDYFPDNPWD